MSNDIGAGRAVFALIGGFARAINREHA